MRLRVLCTGDVHVGRRPSHLPPFMQPHQSSCAAMFGQIVERAVTEKVDFVAISGDLIDKDNKYYEAYGPVERGLRRLASAGIQTVAVAGNHDFDALPRLVDAVGEEHFHLLGRGGTWQSVPLRRDGQTVMQVTGWSFPVEHVPDNPMRGFSPCDGDGLPVLGLLHADLDQPGSRYAPVPLRDLQAAPVSMWLLGHVHRPRWIPQDAQPPILYPGSPQAMDPGETGAHGPWIIEIGGSGRGADVASRQVPLSPVRYHDIAIDLTGVDTREKFDALVPRQLQQQLEAACDNGGPLEFCSCRLRLVGVTPLHRTLAGFCRELDDLELHVRDFTARIDDVVIDTRPPIDLRELARGSDVPADLARMLLHLQGDGSDGAGEEINHVIGQVVELAEGIQSARAYQRLERSSLPPPVAREKLLRQGMLLLDALLTQKEAT